MRMMQGSCGLRQDPPIHLDNPPIVDYRPRIDQIAWWIRSIDYRPPIHQIEATLYRSTIHQSTKLVGGSIFGGFCYPDRAWWIHIALGRGGFGRPMVLRSGPSKSREFSWRRAARVLRAPRRTTPTGRGHQTGGMVCPDMMRVAWASSRFHTRMRRAAVELPVSGQIRHGSLSPAGGRAGCHERSRTGVAAGGTFPRTRCTSRGLSAGPVLARAALLWCSPAAFQIRHGALFARRTA